MLGRVIGTVVILLVLYAIISDPLESAATTRNGVSALGDAGTSITVFLSTVVDDLAVNTGSTSSSQLDDSTSRPRGGVETGDGSTPIPP